jgi:hypothetical protein
MGINLGEAPNYNEYIAENTDAIDAYSEYVALNIEQSLAYSEYVAKNVVNNLDVVTTNNQGNDVLVYNGNQWVNQSLSDYWFPVSNTQLLQTNIDDQPRRTFTIPVGDMSREEAEQQIINLMSQYHYDETTGTINVRSIQTYDLVSNPGFSNAKMNTTDELNIPSEFFTFEEYIKYLKGNG